MNYTLCKDCKYYIALSNRIGKCTHPERQNKFTAFVDITNVEGKDYCALGCTKKSGGQ